ncbi:MAG: hypothetical protein RLZZ293_276 [Pseudomonadota bacterium]|jgi:NADP-dependent alcohol dehydrogenase
MHNFTFYNPVQVVFGKGQISQLTNLVKGKQKILLTYGGGSIKANGVYQQVIDALAGYSVIEFAGIEANPDYATLMRAVQVCQTEQVDLILAVGGGSIIDGSKFIALATKYNGDAWDILTKPDVTYTSAIDLGVVLTLPATGSEMNCGAVVSRREIGAKQAFIHPLVYPKFAILDPETTYTLPKRQLQNGIVDPFIHVTEQYLTTNRNSAIQDGFAETILKTLISVGKEIVEGTQNYDIRANWMWAATNALNGLIGIGVDQDWATHMIGHELTAAYGLDHGQTLAIIAPQLWRQQKELKAEKLVQFARNVWGLENSNPDVVIEQAIIKTEEFFHSLGVKTHFTDYGIEVDHELITQNVFKYQSQNLGENRNIDANAVKQLLTWAK